MHVPFEEFVSRGTAAQKAVDEIMREHQINERERSEILSCSPDFLEKADG